jgi:two-component system, OmpR family, sensor kinase
MTVWRLLALLPALFGGAAALVLLLTRESIPIAYLRADLGTLFLIVGILISLPAGTAVFFYEYLQNEKSILQNKIQEQTAGERRRFLRRLDHELKNPLTAIRAGLANLSEAPTGPARQEAIGSIDAQALRLSSLAKDLRKLAELETRPLDTSQVDLQNLLNDACSLAGDLAEVGERRLTLSLPKAPWPLPMISGDPDLILLALHNLLDNAIKFTCPGDMVEVRAFEDGANVVIEIADTGPGIADGDLPHVWEELYRGKSAHGIPGSGLGLALVRAIADRHNGQVNLRSRAGQGTVFTFKLPIG